jgi:hypothetical protein
VDTAAFSGDGTRVVTASRDKTARIWVVTWATLVRGDTLRERVCDEKLIGAAQEFTDGEMEDPILRGIGMDDPVARNPCLRRGPLSLDYWTRLPGGFWRSIRWLVMSRSVPLPQEGPSRPSRAPAAPVVAALNAEIVSSGRAANSAA